MYCGAGALVVGAGALGPQHPIGVHTKFGAHGQLDCGGSFVPVN